MTPHTEEPTFEKKFVDHDSSCRSSPPTMTSQQQAITRRKKENEIAFDTHIAKQQVEEESVVSCTAVDAATTPLFLQYAATTNHNL